jgi:hypothetical protein
VDSDFAPWLTSTTALKGPDAHAFVDPTDHVKPGQLAPRAEDEITDRDDPLSTLGPHDCDASWDPGSALSWSGNRNQSATQLFYFVNTFHDHLAADPIDFHGLENGDAVLAQALDGAATAGGLPDPDHLNNASFLTLPAGEPGLLEAYLFSHAFSPFGGNYDAADDATMMFHEYTHGLSGRLVTDAQGFGALDTAQAGAIGEGTSDFYALDYMESAGLIGPGEELRIGAYLDGTASHIREQPIDTDVPTGFTYEDFGTIAGTPEVHADGEIWAQTLWDLRDALGSHDALAAITEAMRLSPPQPSFLDMRNAILQAHGGDDSKLWDVFAARKMGYFAASAGSGDTAPIPDDSVDPGSAAYEPMTGTVRDDEGRPVPGAHVAIAGHDTQGGLGPALADQTDAAGSYSISAPPHDYAFATASAPAHRDARHPVTVPATGEDFTLERDWSSAAGGAKVKSFTGPDNSASGCGPGGLIDDRSDSVWGSDSAPGGRSIVIDLGAPVDVEQVAIDPGAGCGDDASAGLRAYALLGATGPDEAFHSIGQQGAFGPGLGGALQDVTGTSAPRIRYLELRALTPQDDSPGGSGADFLDVAELHVAKQPGTALWPSVATGAAQGVGAAIAGLTGSVAPHGGSAQVLFEYGPTKAYGFTVAARSLAPGEAPVAVGAVAGGLVPLTVYHYRAVAVRDGHRFPGGDRTFVTTAPATVPPPVDPPAKPPAASLARLRDSRLVADRRGRFKVRIAFKAAAPSGTARVAVKRKGRKLAAARTRVRPGRTATVKLRLSAAGRRAIRPGRRKLVRVELRLPGGGKITKQLRLARRR